MGKLVCFNQHPPNKFTAPILVYPPGLYKTSFAFKNGREGVPTMHIYQLCPFN